MALKVSFDDEIFYLQRQGGISRYFANLITQFESQQDLEIDSRLTFSRTENEAFLETLWYRNFRSTLPVPQILQRIGTKNRSVSEVLRAWHSGIKKSPASDILHATYWAPRKSDLEKHSHLAVTVMDLIPELMDSQGFEGKHGSRRKLLDKASVVFVISNTTGNLLKEFFPSVSAPVITTYLGVNQNIFSPGVRGSKQLNFPYVLFVGNRHGYKRFDIAVESIAGIRRNGLDVGLVAVGPPPTPQEMEFIGRQIPRDPFAFRRAKDFELAQLYGMAELFVFPSSMEGFGLPTLGAMACGCPTLLTDIPTFRELAGDSALYANNYDQESFTFEMERIIVDSDLRQHLISSGLDHASSFTWKRTAELTASGYHIGIHDG